MTKWKSPRCSAACWDEIKAHEATQDEMFKRLIDVTRDRDEWRTQHENLLAMYRAEISRTPVAERGGGGASSARPNAAIENLNRHQVQCDKDGVMVQVSRQALDETLAYLSLPSPSPTPETGDGSETIGGGK